MDIFNNLTREQVKATKAIGLQIREERENLGYTLDYVSDVIRISVHTIQQLEEGNYAFFRNMVFLKGSLRNYCNFLKIDPIPFLEEVDNLFTKNVTPTEYLETSKKHFLKTPFFVNLIISFTVVSLIGIGIYFLFFNSFTKDSNPLILQESVERQTPEPLVEKKLILSLSANKDGWARIDNGGKRVFEIYLIKKVDYSWVVAENFELILSTQDLATVSLNKTPAILLLEKEKDIITTFNFNSF